MNSDIVKIEKCKNLLMKKETDGIYHELIKLLLDNGLYNEASDYCEKYLNYHECEDSYMLMLEYFYVTKDEKKFVNLFEKFVYSPIKLTEKGNSFVRYWIE